MRSARRLVPTVLQIEGPRMNSVGGNRERAITDLLLERGCGPFFGTPCGVLAPLYATMEERASLMAVTREDNAVGLAAGAALANRLPVVLMQNSGLGQSVNAIASLVMPYELPILLIVSMRGEGIDTTLENAAMGRATEPILDALEVHCFRLFEGSAATDTLGSAVDRVRDTNRTVAVLVPPTYFGWFG